MSSFCPEGYKLLNEAIKCDDDNKFEEAYSLYERGIQLIQNTINNTITDKQIKEKLIVTIFRKYGNRIQELKKIVKDIKKKKLSQSQKLNNNKNTTTTTTAAAAAITEDNENTNYDNSLIKYIETYVTVPEDNKVKMSDIKGLEVAKDKLTECTVYQFTHKQFFRLTTWNGILLYGPSGK